MKLPEKKDWLMEEKGGGRPAASGPEMASAFSIFDAVGSVISTFRTCFIAREHALNSF